MKPQDQSHYCHFTASVSAEILAGLGGGLPSDIRSMLCNSKFTDILSASVDPHGYSDWRTFFRDYQAISLVSKWDGLPVGIDTQQVAIDKFLECEAVCNTVNRRLLGYSVPFPGSDVRNVFNVARRKIARVLGAFSWDDAGRYMAFGPGASIGVTRKKRHAVHKFGLVRPTVTGECATFAELLIGSSPQWSKTVPALTGKTEDCLSIVRGSRITTVPKSAKTDRVIAIEPLMNMFIQKGIGGVIRRKLRSVGIDLDSQARNQHYAKCGSVSGQLATIDLSSASDSISRGLVDFLVPDDWLTAMKVCRSKSSTLPSGEEIFLQKFSSMGNGFTFELESLIFWALCSACISCLNESSHELCVYGDDLIVPVSVVPLLSIVLSFAGFTLNSEKSFWEGRFRESCGKHFFSGHDVSPMYIRKDINTEERKLWAANSTKRLAHRLYGLDYGLDAALKPAYDYIVAGLGNRCKRLSISDGFGDGGLIRDFDEARPSKAPNGVEGWVGRQLVRSYKKTVPSEQPALTTSLSKTWKRARAPGVRGGLRNGTRFVDVHATEPTLIQWERFNYEFIKLVMPRWVNLGPWRESL